MQKTFRSGWNVTEMPSYLSASHLLRLQEKIMNPPSVLDREDEEPSKKRKRESKALSHLLDNYENDGTASYTNLIFLEKLRADLK